MRRRLGEGDLRDRLESGIRQLCAHAGCFLPTGEGEVADGDDGAEDGDDDGEGHAVAVLLVGEGDEVHVAHERLGGVHRSAAGEHVDELEDLEHVGDHQDGDDRERLAHHRHRDVPKLLPPGRSVDGARLDDVGRQELQVLRRRSSWRSRCCSR